MIVRDFDDMRIGTTPLSKLYYGHDLIWKRKDEGLVIITTETNIFTVPRMDYSSVTGTIDWGDGQTDEYNSDTSITHNYLDLKSWTIKINAPIKTLDYLAFENYSSLASITIPDSVTLIGNNAFYGCTNLTSVTIPDSVTNIGMMTFQRCTSLASITIPDSVITINSFAFSDCTSLTSITIPDSVTSIEGCAFQRCTSLTTITIPDSVTSIGNSAFYKCTSLTSVTIPNSVKSIGQRAFANTKLTSVTIAEDCTYSSNSFPSGCVINRY